MNTNSQRRHLLARSLGLLAAGALPLPMTASAIAAGLPDLVATLKPSIVGIGIFGPLQNPQFRFLGTGFAVGNGKQIVTCAHVLPTIDPAKRESIAIAVPGADTTKVYEAKLDATNRDADLAVLTLEGPALPAMSLAAVSEVREGVDVMLIGFPLGNSLGLFPATHRGVIAAITPMFIPAANSAQLRAQNLQVMRGEPIRLLQLDATTFPGNSGGPLVDIRTGRVVGVISLGLAKGTRESAIQYPTGISYAVPVDYLAPLIAAR